MPMMCVTPMAASAWSARDVVDVQVPVEVAGDAGEDHRVGMVCVDQVLGGGGGVDQSHAADGRDGGDGASFVGSQRAARHVEAGLAVVGDVVK